MSLFRCVRAACLLIAIASAVGVAQAMPIREVVSPGGIRAWLVEDHASKVISLDFAIKCGSACDPAAKRGLSMFAMGLLDEGAGPYDSGQYQGRLADLAATIDFNAGEDWLTGSLATLASSRDEVFDLLRLGLTQPRFDGPAVERVRAEMDQLIEGQLENPDAVAGHLFLGAEFPGHPYAAWMTGTKASIAGITIDDLKEFAKGRLGRDGLLVSVVGDITEPDLKILLDKTFGALPAVSTGAVVPASVAAQAVASTVLAHRDNPQTVMRFGQPGPCVSDKDYFAARLVTQILGGGTFTARLEQEVREKRGLAYGITVSLMDRLHTCFLEGRVGTQNGRVAETMEIVRREWAKMRDAGPDDSELKDAKTYLNGSYTIGLDSSGAIAERLIGLQEEGLGPDYFERRPKLIDAVTPEEARRVAKSLLDPGRLLFAVVGAPEGIKPDKTLDGTE